MKLNMANYNLLHESLKNLTLPTDDFNKTSPKNVIRLPTNLDLTKERVSLLGPEMKKTNSKAYRILHGIKVDQIGDP